MYVADLKIDIIKRIFSINMNLGVSNIMRNIIYMFALLIMLTLIAACVSVKYKSIVPVAPLSLKGPYQVEVKSQQVILEWKMEPEPGVTYDIALYQAILAGERFVRGDQIYYRENLENNKHLVEYNFAENTMYYWTVRKRINGQAAEWATYDITDIEGNYKKNEAFSFCYHCNSFFGKGTGQ